MMMLADFGKLILLVSLPIGYLFGHFSVYHLYVIQAGMSALSALFDAAYGACLPSLVSKDQLREANSVLQTGISLSQILGPALGGTMVAAIGAPYTIFVTAGTYLISIFSLVRIRKSFSVIHCTNQSSKPDMLSQIKEGFLYVWNQKLIRTTGIFLMDGLIRIIMLLMGLRMFSEKEILEIESTKQKGLSA